MFCYLPCWLLAVAWNAIGWYVCRALNKDAIAGAGKSCYYYCLSFIYLSREKVASVAVDVALQNTGRLATVVRMWLVPERIFIQTSISVTWIWVIFWKASMLLLVRVLAMTRHININVVCCKKSWRLACDEVMENVLQKRPREAVLLQWSWRHWEDRSSW